MLTDFQNYFTDRLSSEPVVNRKLQIHPSLGTSLLCQMFVRNNRHVPEPSEANCHARLSHSKQLLELRPICPLTKTYFYYSGHAEKPTVLICSNKEERPRDKTPAHTIDIQSVTDGISRRVISGR